MLVSRKESFKVYCRHESIGNWVQYGSATQVPHEAAVMFDRVQRIYPGKKYKVERTTTIVEEVDITTFSK